MRLRWVVGLGAAWLVFTACGGKSDDEKGGTPSGGLSGAGGTTGVPSGWTVACARSPEVVCQKWETCAPDLAEIVLGSDCPRDAETACGNVGRLADTGVTPTDYVRCLEAVARLSCEQWLYGNSVLPECQGFVGTRPVGNPCGSGLQCASGACSVSLGCGVCETRAAAGESCLERLCEEGLECNPQATCSAPRLLGAPCSEELPCSAVLVCRAGICSPPPGIGEPCATSGLGCDLLGGAACNYETMLCEAMQIPGRGETCSGICAVGSVCADATLNCVAALPEGAPCMLDEEEDDLCDRSLECINGICGRFDPTTCN